MKGNLLIPLVIFSVILVDQLSKYALAFLGWSSVCNLGIAFGIGKDLALIAPIILVIVLALLIYEEQQLAKIALAIIFAGGLSNFLDRIFAGCVRDFVKIGSFPAFNLADSAITIGVVLVLYGLFAGSLISREKK